MVLRFVASGEPVVDEGDGHGGKGFGEVELGKEIVTFWSVLNSKMLVFFVLLRE